MTEVTLNIANLLNFSQAAHILGVSRPTIYQFIKRHKLHPLAIGRSRYLMRDEVEILKMNINNPAPAK